MNKTIEFNITEKNIHWCLTYSIEENTGKMIFDSCDKWENGKFITVSKNTIPAKLYLIINPILENGYIRGRKASDYFFATSDIADLPEEIKEKCSNISLAVSIYNNGVKIEYYMDLED